MTDPLSMNGLSPIQPGQVGTPGGVKGPEKSAGGQSFKDMLLDNLEEVNRLQQEATDGVEKVVTGQTDNLAEVFTAVRKADVAFSMMMEMRNKLVEAYRDIQQMRV